MSRSPARGSVHNDSGQADHQERGAVQGDSVQGTDSHHGPQRILQHVVLWILQLGQRRRASVAGKNPLLLIYTSVGKSYSTT